MSSVLFLDHSGLPGGGQLGLARYLLKTRLTHIRLILLSDGPAFDEVAASGTPVEVLGSGYGVFGMFAVRSKLGTRLRDLAPDVIVANSNKSALILASLPRTQRATLVYYMRDDLNPRRKSLLKRLLLGRWMLSRFDRIIANSEWTASTIPSPRLRRETAIAYPVSGLKTRRVQLTGAASSSLRVLSLSRIARWKGIHVLLEAIMVLENRGYVGVIDVTIAGSSVHEDARYEIEVRERARELRSSVRFLGHVNSIGPLLDANDVLVACSISPEPFGQVVVQGLAAGLVTIASEEGGPREVVTNRKDGLLVSPGDPIALADALEYVMNHPAEARHIGSQAVNSAERFSDRATVLALDEQLTEISKKSASSVFRPSQRYFHTGAVNRPGRRTAPPVRVLQAIPDPARRGYLNPYNELLVRSLPEARIRSSYLRWPRSLYVRFDVLHTHWPEQLVRHPTRVGRVVKRFLALVLLGRVVALRTPVVRTMHNVAPHEAGGHFEKWYVDALDRRTTWRIHLNSATPIDPSDRSSTIRHGHYRGWYTESPRSSTDGRLLLFGLLREYKGIDDLLRVADGLDAQSRISELRIVGRPDSEALAERLRAAERRYRHVSLRLGFLAEQELSAEIASSHAVVLPYEEMHNSGAAILALSLGRPIIVRSSPVARELEEEFGREWVTIVNGELTTASLEAAAAECFALVRPELPDLKLRDWAVLGRQLAGVYEAAARTRGRTKGLLKPS